MPKGIGQVKQQPTVKNQTQSVSHSVSQSVCLSLYQSVCELVSLSVSKHKF